MKRYLVLQDGTCFEGEAFGAEGSAVGELVFTTGVVGYNETLTDPSYLGQIIVQTFPMIGNYGIIPQDFEGNCMAKAYVVREYCDAPSNFRCEMDIDSYLKSVGVPGICGVDTRAITRILREKGVMNAIVCDEIPSDLSAVKEYKIVDAVKKASHNSPIVYPPEGKKALTVVVMDFGAKGNIMRSLENRGCECILVPGSTSAEEILAMKPNGIMLSNGPGDPAENVEIIAELSKLFGKLPIFGICLGHQLMALSCGAETTKLKYGHRGGNQPVKDLLQGNTFITSQNHGYAVVSETLKRGKLRYINANDGSCEGIDYPEDKAFSVQFHPEACCGPKDSDSLFDRFCNLMKEGK